MKDSRVRSSGLLTAAGFRRTGRPAGTIGRCLTCALGAILVAYGGSAGAAPTASSKSRAFHTLLAQQWEHYLAVNPEAASLLGDRRYNDRWADASLAHAQSERAATKTFLEKFEAVDSAGLSPEDKLNKDLMVRQLKFLLRGYELKTYEMPIYFWHNSMPLQMAEYASVFPFETVKDYDDYITRLKRVPLVLDDIRKVANRGRRDGLLPPRYLLSKVGDRLDSIAAPAGPDSAFAEPLKHFPAGISEAQRARIAAELVGAIDTQVRPAYRRLSAFVKDEYAPHGRQEPGLWSLPHGDEIYRFMVEGETTTNQTPAHIHEIGLAEVARIETEMLAIARTQGYGDLASFRAAVKADPRLHASSREDLLARYRGYIEGMKPLLPKLFGMLPKTDLVVVPVETFREATSPIAGFQQGSPDGTRPARVEVNTGSFNQRSTLSIEATAYHEGVPGHHLQFSIAQTLPGLPPFRQQAFYGAYVEGWALYAERLGKEVGLYKDPLSDYGRLISELRRANRMVLDTGVHHKHWTRQQMLDFFRAHSGEDEATINSEVDRYISIPAQALTYKVGELEILSLRKMAEAALGDHFDIRAFHDQIIGEGALPLDVLKARVGTWIDHRRGTARWEADRSTGAVSRRSP
jgi:uncharacterized protein (DUF885 family)